MTQNATMHDKTGVLLLNIGTPDSTSTRDVRRYLREFLSDPRVLDMPPVGRWLLLNLVILPTRPRASAAAYRKVWTEPGSPLMVHSRALQAAVANALGETFQVELAMRYGNPGIAPALARLRAAGVRRIVLLPLFPQYSAAATSSALARVFELLGQQWDVPEVVSLPDFFDHPGFIRAVAAGAREVLVRDTPDHVLFSYHGLPERQIRRSDASEGHCLADDECCEAIVPANRGCYRAQAFATSRAVARELSLEPANWSVAFQSRLGRTPWILPHTDKELPRLAASGVKRLAVLCPSFTSDCLETVEEIGLRGREQWRELGGEAFSLIPCVNAQADWVESVAEMVRAAVTPDTSASATETPSR
jgi:ferrochelatase